MSTLTKSPRFTTGTINANAAHDEKPRAVSKELSEAQDQVEQLMKLVSDLEQAVAPVSAPTPAPPEKAGTDSYGIKIADGLAAVRSGIRAANERINAIIQNLAV